MRPNPITSQTKLHTLPILFFFAEVSYQRQKQNFSQVLSIHYISSMKHMAPLWHINYKTHHLFIQTVYYIYLQIGIKALFYFLLFSILHIMWLRDSQEMLQFIQKFFVMFFIIEYFFLVILIVFAEENVEKLERLSSWERKNS